MGTPRKRTRTPGAELLPKAFKDKKTKPYASQPEKIQKVVDYAEKNGELPPPGVLEALFPGVTISHCTKHELSLSVIFSLKMRGMKVAQIAQVMKVQPETVKKAVKRLSNQFEIEAGGISVAGAVGHTMATYRELQAASLKILHDTKDKNTNNKLRAITVAASMEKSIVDTLRVSGFFENSHLSPAPLHNKPKTDAGALQDMLRQFLTGNPDEFDVDDVEDDDLDDGFDPSTISLTGF